MKFCILSVVLLHFVSSFNVDYEYTVLKNGPSDSLFGFSVAEHHERTNKWLIIGAPRANNTYLGSYDTPGTVFKCDATDASFDCTEEIPFDKLNNGPSNSESKSNEWMGVTLKSQGKDKSVVTCSHRYVSHGPLNNFRLHEGKCYGAESDLSYPLWFTSSPCGAKNSIPGIETNHDYYGQCETGIGMDIYPEFTDTDSVNGVFGSVGALTYTGRLFEKDSDENIYNEFNVKKAKIDHNSYFGYSIALGNYYSSSAKDVASGGPRHKSFGKVLLFKDKNRNSFYQSLPNDGEEIQIASGYGISLCAIDTNNNGLSELIVGAPFYAPKEDRNKPDSGLVYVYHKPDGKGKGLFQDVNVTVQVQNDELELQQILMGKKPKSNFGYAVTSAGDLNNDGYNDLIVGAPHEDEGTGAVYIFQGSKDGLLNAFTQHIKASTIQSGLSDNVGLKGFGRSLAGGLDMDDNGYDDVLVGSYISNQAVLLRSRPVVSTAASITFSPKQLNISDKDCLQENKFTVCFNMKFCHNFSEPSNARSNKTVMVRYSITADPLASKPRVKFADSKTNNHIIYVKSINSEKCQVINNLYLVFNEDDTIAEYPDITFAIQHEFPYGDGPNEIKKPTRSNTIIPSLDAYPALYQRFEKGKVSTSHFLNIDLPFKRDCVECIPDLVLLSEHQNYTLRLGATTFRFNVSLENIGLDPAFSVSMKFNLTKDLTLDHIIVEEEVFFCTKDLCEDVFNKFKKNSKQEIGIVLNTKEFTPTSQNNIALEVMSVNKEKTETLSNNALNITFDIKVVADVQMLAVASTQNIVYQGKIKGESAMKNLEEAGQLVEHKYIIRNNGPDSLPKANVTIHWPYETLSGKHLLYLVDVVTSSSKVECSQDIRKLLNVAKIKRNSRSPSNINSVSSRRRRDIDDSTDNSTTTIEPGVVKEKATRKKDGIILDCYEGTAKCLTLTCTVTSLESATRSPSDSTATITINSRLWEASLLLDYYGDVLTVVSHATVDIGTNASYISDPNPKNNAMEIYTVINPEFAPKSKSTGLEVWQIALAAIAGIILLALLIFGLYKVGFFKRKRFTTRSKKDDKLIKNGK